MTKVKICGLTTQETVLAACTAGADLVGFVFAKSRRQVTPVEARILAQEVPKAVLKVGVFLNPSSEELRSICQQVPLDLLQIHGEVPQGVLPRPVIRAVNINETQLTLPSISEQEFLLLDAPVTEYGGGSGQTFDWQRALAIPLPKQQLFIAGGLNSENVRQAISCFDPFGVDVSSGVETNGYKDPAKIKAFIQQVKK
jgi:phosphoribosylanthranilate isomerase